MIVCQLVFWILQIFCYSSSVSMAISRNLPSIQSLQAAINKITAFINIHKSQPVQIRNPAIFKPKMKKVYTPLGHFLIGLCDSLSPSWIPDLLFYTNPQTGKILPQSIKLQKVLGRSLLQAGLITTFLPLILKQLGFYYLGWAVMALSLIFTYGYLVFYNMEVTREAMQIVVWKSKKHKDCMPQLDIRQKIDPITDISNQLQSFIFEMVYYTPVNLLLIVFTMFDDLYFPWLMTLMDCFFNTAFYYFRKWPYDKYNVAFLEAHLSYAMGYGAFVSLVSNIVLPTSMSIGGYLLISQWMIINALCHTPPEVQFNSIAELWNVMSKKSERRKLPSAYNIHRKKLRTQLQYRIQVMRSCIFMRSFFVLTARINSYLQRHIFKQDISLPENECKSQNMTEISGRELSPISEHPQSQSSSSGTTIIVVQNAVKLVSAPISKQN